MNPNNQGWSAAFKSALLILLVEIVIGWSIYQCCWLAPVIKTAALRLLTPNN